MTSKTLLAAIALALLPGFAIAAPMTPKPVPAAVKSAKADKAKIAKPHHVIQKVKAKPSTTHL